MASDSTDMLENYSESADRNREPILEKLRSHLHGVTSVLEIGSGSGQHALYVTEHLPNLAWQTSETAGNLPALQHNLELHSRPSLPPPLLLEVGDATWPVTIAEHIFTANTLHIMPWHLVEKLFDGIGRVLKANGLLCIYGAMRYNEAFTSDSNAHFDAWLKKQDPLRGIRDFEEVDRLARAQGLELLADHAMPSNNQLLVWQRKRGRTP